MPAGDPAGYLPNVLKSRKRKGQTPYHPRRRRNLGPSVPKGDAQTGGTEAPAFGGFLKPFPLPKIRGAHVPPPGGARPTKKRKYMGRAR